MTDPSQLSDAELFAIAGVQPPAAAPAAPMAAPRAAPSPNLTPEALFPALVQQESRGRAGAVGPNTQWGNALGKTQMLPATAREMAQRVGVPFDERRLRGTSPEDAAYQDQLGLAYLQQGFERTGNAREALMYYHGGPDRRLWGPKTRQYAEDVLRRVQNGDLAQVSTGQQQPAQPDLSQMSDAELMALVGEQPKPDYVVPEGVLDYETLSPEQRSQLTRGTRLLLPPDRPGEARQIVTLARDLSAPQRDAIMGEQQQTFGGVQTYTPGMADSVAALASGASEQIPGLDELQVAADAALSGRSFSDARDEYQLMQQALNSSNRGERVAGGIAGFGLGLAAPGGAFIARGPNAAYRATRAAAVGGGTGAIYGAGAADGGLQERLQGAGVGAGLGAIGGAGFSGVADALGGIASRAQPSAARRLSREGVDLTPGQMVSEIPLVGPMLRGIEEGASSIPIVGAPIAAARERSLETFNRAAINRALTPIGERLPRNTEMGYGAVEEAQNRLGAAYDDVLPRITARLDQPLYDTLGEILNRAASEMPEDLTRQLASVAQNRVFRGLDDANATIDGQQFKRIESELGALAREYRNTNDPAARAFGRSVEEMRQAVRDMVARQNPAEAARIADINRGYANLVRVEEAAGSSASQAAEGVFSPTQLGVAAGRGASRSSRGSGDALMQDLASAGRAVLPSRVGDSGTATRGALTGLVAGAGAVVNPAVALPTAIATMAGYSRPVQGLLNAVYRAADRPGATAEALSRLALAARQNPALVPVYERALLQGQLSGELQSRQPSPAPRGLFGARRPQMVPQQ